MVGAPPTVKHSGRAIVWSMSAYVLTKLVFAAKLLIAARPGGPHEKGMIATVMLLLLSAKGLMSFGAQQTVVQTRRELSVCHQARRGHITLRQEGNPIEKHAVASVTSEIKDNTNGLR